MSSGRLREGQARTSDGEDADLFMSPAELRDLIARGHVIGCHTHSHRRLAADVPTAVLRDEIVAARERLEQATGRPCEDFCWVGGEDWSYSRPAQALIEEAGYRRGFMTNCSLTTARTDPFWIDRTNVEADWPLPKVRFYLSGTMDAAYARKRRRLRRKLGATN